MWIRRTLASVVVVGISAALWYKLSSLSASAVSSRAEAEWSAALRSYTDYAEPFVRSVAESRSRTPSPTSEPILTPPVVLLGGHGLLAALSNGWHSVSAGWFEVVVAPDYRGGDKQEYGRTLEDSEHPRVRKFWWAPGITTRTDYFPRPDEIGTFVVVDVSKGSFVGNYTFQGMPSGESIPAHEAKGEAWGFDAQSRQLIAHHLCNVSPDKQYSADRRGEIIPYHRIRGKMEVWVRSLIEAK